MNLGRFWPSPRPFAPAATQQALLDDAEVAVLQRMAATTERQAVWRLIDHHQSGEGLSLRLGSGLDYAESRAYQAGDDLRHLDWRITARTGRPHVRRFHEEHQPVWAVALDRGLSMRFGTRVRLKAAQAARVAVYLSALARQLGLGVHASVYDEDDGPRALAPSLAPVPHVEEFIRPCPPWVDGDAADSHDQAMLDWLASWRRVPAGSQLWWITDARAWSPAQRQCVQALATRLSLVLIRIVDPAERQLPALGWATLSDLRGRAAHGLRLGRDPASAALATAFRAACRIQDETLAACQARCIELATTVEDFTPELWHG